MDLSIHGEAKTLHHDSLTVTERLDAPGVGQCGVAVERNRRVVPRARHEITTVGQGDVIDLVSFVGGG